MFYWWVQKGERLQKDVDRVHDHHFVMKWIIGIYELFQCFIWIKLQFILMTHAIAKEGLQMVIVLLGCHVSFVHLYATFVSTLFVDFSLLVVCSSQHPSFLTQCEKCQHVQTVKHAHISYILSRMQVILIFLLQGIKIWSKRFTVVIDALDELFIFIFLETNLSLSWMWDVGHQSWFASIVPNCMRHVTLNHNTITVTFFSYVLLGILHVFYLILFTMLNYHYIL